MAQIGYLENGMDLDLVRDIINQMVEKLNSIETSPRDYNDLENKPAINGVELSSSSSMSEFPINIEDTTIIESVINTANETAAVAAENTATELVETELSEKMPLNLSSLPPKQYDYSEETIVAITHNDITYQSKMKDIATYLEYLIKSKSCCNETAPVGLIGYDIRSIINVHNQETGFDELTWDATGAASFSIVQISENANCNIQTLEIGIPHKILIVNTNTGTDPSYKTINFISYLPKYISEDSEIITNNNAVIYTVIVIPINGVNTLIIKKESPNLIYNA